MANGITTAFWSVTINNYSESQLALVRSGYPDYCREIVHTLEEGEGGTPHIQAWVKLMRQQRMAFVRKLFPGGHYRPLTSDEYIQNTKDYCQKLDSTARSGAVHRFNDPMPTLETVCRRVANRVNELHDDYLRKMNAESWDELRLKVQRDMVAMEDFKFAKVFVSASYKQVWKEYGVEMCMYFRTHTHTHTHTEEVAEVNIPTTDADEASDDSEGEDSCGGDEASGAGDETDDESGSGSDCEEDA